MHSSVNRLILITALSITPFTAWSYSFDVNVDTSNLSGTMATLAFDFIDGDGAVNNTVQISNFLPSGSYSSGPNTGDVSGSLSSTVFLGDNSLFINEFLQSITLGNDLQFHIETSNLFNPSALAPDSFAFFILDSSASQPLFSTTDSIGADALFAIDLTGANDGLHLFTTTSGSSWTLQPSGVSVPTPSPLLLLVVGIWCAYMSRKRTLSDKKAYFQQHRFVNL